MIIFFITQDTLRKLYMWKPMQAREKLNRSTGELKVEKDYLNNLKERQRGYHKCLQDGCTFKRKTSRRICTYSTSICKLPTVLYIKILKLVEKDTDWQKTRTHKTRGNKTVDSLRETDHAKYLLFEKQGIRVRGGFFLAKQP